MLPVLVVGEVVLDVSRTVFSEPIKLRLGGVVHACRALWALGVPYELAYIAPAYMHHLVNNFVLHHGCSRVTSLGTVLGCPGVIFIENVQETAHQGYEHLLRDEYECVLDRAELQKLEKPEFRDVLVFPAAFALQPVLSALGRGNARVHVDVANTPGGLGAVGHLGRAVSTLFTSTSSQDFYSMFDRNPQKLVEAALSQGNIERIILKENRGGARFAYGGQRLEVGAQLRPVAHSVGVGDAFDAAYVAFSAEESSVALAYASWISAAYATTTYPDDFKREVERTLRISPILIAEIPGVRLKWEDRSSHDIYIAAPDFSYCDRTQINAVEAALSYHNFRAHRPVQLFGEATEHTTREERLAMADQDIALLRKCSLVVAVCDQADVGTSVEIGLAHGIGKPVLVFDPRNAVRNPMILGTASEVVTSIDDLLVAIFSRLGHKVGVQ